MIRNVIIGSCGFFHFIRGELSKPFWGDYWMSWNIQRTPHATKRRQTLAWITLLICIKIFFSDAKSNSSIVNLFFQAPERWSLNVLQFLASMVHLGQFVYGLLHGFWFLNGHPSLKARKFPVFPLECVSLLFFRLYRTKQNGENTCTCISCLLNFQ